MLYVHRYLRLTPVLAFIILMSMTLFRFLGNGPMWPKIVDILKVPCDRRWWLPLIYIQNYGNPDGEVSQFYRSKFPTNLITKKKSPIFSVILGLGIYQLICNFISFHHSSFIWSIDSTRKSSTHCWSQFSVVLRTLLLYMSNMDFVSCCMLIFG